MQEEAQRIMDAQKKQRDAGYLAGEIERDPFDIHWLNKERAALIVEALLAFAQSATASITDNDRRWRFLEHGCQWVSFTPIGGETKSFDPRHVTGYDGALEHMRAYADEQLAKQVAQLRAEAEEFGQRLKK